MICKCATKLPFQLFLYLTTTCLSEFALFINVDYPNKTWTIIFPAQTQTSNVFSLNLLLMIDLIFSSGIYNIFEGASSSLTCIPWHSLVAEAMPQWHRAIQQGGRTSP